MKRHPFDPTAFVFGGLFLTIAVLGLLDASTLSRIRISVLVPAVLVTIGATLLLGSLVPGRGSAVTPGAAAGGQGDVTAPS
jgi:hypothetical protein